MGSIITGRIPKASIWQIINGNVDFLDSSCWYDEDVAYLWKSRDEQRKMYDQRSLEKSIDNICRMKDLNDLSEPQLAALKIKIEELVQKYNRVVL